MITFLKIRNLALIEDAEVEFGAGFNVFTGETGAGKSVLLGGLLLALGGRADKSLIRTGCARCEVAAQIRVGETMQGAVAALLEENGVDFPDSFLSLRRVITASSVRNFVNDSAVGSKLLQELAALLIDVHAANEHQSLHDPSRQLALLDRYAGTENDIAACAAICGGLRELEAERKAFESSLPSALEAEHFNALASEIGELDLHPGEEEELVSRYNLAANSREVLDIAAELQNALNEGDDSLSERMTNVYRKLSGLSRFCEGGENEKLLDLCANIEEQLRDLSGQIENLAGRVELDPAELEKMERRLSDISTMKRRYGAADLSQLLEIMAEAESKLSLYRSGDGRRREFAEQRKVLENELLDAAQKLSRKRREAAKKFCGEILSKLRLIGFPKSQLEMRFTEKAPDANGMDATEFYFSANSGEPPQPLRKVGSSGELSRLMLAIKNVIADNDSVESVVFDEIDVNIGGETALQVGRELEKLGQKRQILAISHLPQVAARAENHFLLSKRENSGRTVSEVRALSFEGRVRELARMLGNTPGALEHAKLIFEEKEKEKTAPSGSADAGRAGAGRRAGT